MNGIKYGNFDRLRKIQPLLRPLSYPITISSSNYLSCLSDRLIGAENSLNAGRMELKYELLRELEAVNGLWHDEYNAIKTAFITFTQDIFRGSCIRETSFSLFTQEFTDSPRQHLFVRSLLFKSKGETHEC